VSLDGILDSIATGIASAVQALKTCEVIGGNVDIAEVLRRSRQLPAVFVFCAGSEDAARYQDKVKTRALFVAVAVVKANAEAPPTKNDRARVAARIAGRLLYSIAFGSDWGNAEVDGDPINIDSRNRYTTTSDEKGAAIWAVSWEQMISLSQDPPPDELDDLDKIVATYELQDGTTPAVDAVDEIDLT